MNILSARLGKACVYIVLLTACGGGQKQTTTEPPPPPPTQHPSAIRIIEGGSGTDTIRAVVTPVVVEVTDSAGTPVSKVKVHLSVPSSGGVNPVDYHLAVLVPGGIDIGEADIVTDTLGRASFDVYFGRFAGPDYTFVASIPGASDTAHYTIEPGQVAKITMEPADTALLIGGSASLRLTVTDGADNPRADVIGFASSDSSITVDNDGHMTARAIGRASIEARVGEIVARTAVSVVPEGTIAAFHSNLRDGYAILLLGLDGNDVQEIDSVGIGTAVVGFSAWSPDGKQLAFTSQALRTLTPGSASETMESTIRIQGSAVSWSPDGAWIYFGGHPPSDSRTLIWRVHPDGTGLDSLTSFGGLEGLIYDDWPSASPDGSRLAFLSNRSGTQRIYLMDLSTREYSIRPMSANSVLWSPTAETLAYVSSGFDELHLVSPDGSNDRILFSTTFVEPAFAWSPDGKWIVVRSGGILNLIRVLDGLVLPVAGTGNFLNPAWRPASTSSIAVPMAGSSP